MFFLLHILCLIGSIRSVLGNGKVPDPPSHDKLIRKDVTSAPLMGKDGPVYTDIAKGTRSWGLPEGVEISLAVLTKLNKAAITNHIKDSGEAGFQVDKATFEIYKDDAWTQHTYGLADLTINGKVPEMTEEATRNWWWKGFGKAVVEAVDGSPNGFSRENKFTPDVILKMLTGRNARKISGASADDLFNYAKQFQHTPVIMGTMALGPMAFSMMMDTAAGENEGKATITYVDNWGRGGWHAYTSTIEELSQAGFNTLYVLEDEGTVP
ncbi:hypothetical protein I302_102601 [Kwoniella bestiolae CBS 10118]|uniref:Uncharacterized protein n=1 Tax=Kwoniella bestiolae CBS 10118 TaxID=1296100 RepID=A0A1B9GFS0_9TREE|nr:hypothetical protein I302_01288 [Kwoniella bestiolae CBS 10118]OCF29775.1 hypothetical protein I302_01288 [Kwoniella bestiolae CBS 10118]